MEASVNMERETERTDLMDEEGTEVTNGLVREKRTNPWVMERNRKR